MVERSGPVVLLVIAASVAVAIGAAGAGLLHPPSRLDEGSARLVRIAGAVIAAVGLLVLLLQRRRQRSTGGRGPNPTGSAVLTAAKIMTVLALIALLMPRAAVDNAAGPASEGGTVGAVTNSDAPRTTAPPPPSSRPPPAGEAPRPANDRDDLTPADADLPTPPQANAPGPGAVADEPGRSIVQRIGRVLLVLLLLGLVVVGLLALTGRLRSGRKQTPPDLPVAATDAEAAVQASLDEVTHGDGDPRRRIAAAYRRLLHALTAAGAAREPQEAPHEHLQRALVPLGVPSEPMHRLAELYVAAEFAERPVTDDHGAAAARALGVSLTHLRETTRARAADARA